MRSNHFVILLFIMVACSCYPEEVEQALQYAGNNREQLEDVLRHYGESPADSLKLKAAEFLIANMPWHYSFDEELLKSYYAKADPIVRSNLSREEKVDTLNIIARDYPRRNLQLIEDIHIIKAEYLIRSIDHAFDNWEHRAWAQHVGFDDFCEYILPYKVTEGQLLDYWRDTLCILFNEGLQNQQYKHSSYHACQSILSTIAAKVQPGWVKDYNGLPFLSASNIAMMPFGNCEDLANTSACVLRSKGIPSMIDFTPQWPSRNLGHSWNVLLVNTGKNITIEGIDKSSPIEPYKSMSKFGKVFRKTYARNEEVLELLLTEKFIPPTLNNIFVKDVTKEYVKTYKVEVDILQDAKIKSKFAYLAVFNNQSWVPIAYGKTRRNCSVFEDIGVDIVYLPVYYTEKREQAFNYPFLLDIKGNISYLIPDTTQKQNMVLYRKYQVSSHVYSMGMRMIGGMIQASNSTDFTNAVTLYEFKDWTTSGSITFQNDTSYRYWRYLSPENSFGYMAELMFYIEDDSIPNQGEVIGTNGFYKDSIRTKYAVFDGDPLTFFDSPEDEINAWVGMDFGKPVDITKITYLPRSDDNNIRIGDEYELFYWGEKGWVSLGGRVAADIKLVYNDVPGNSLFLLRDYTRGQQERIFTYENGQQVWW